MAQSYETLYILRPDLLDEQVQLQVNKYREFLHEHKAEDIQIKTWGKRKLAYPIRKFENGIYVQMNYKGDGTHVEPMQRAMRLSEEVIRYLTVKVKADSATITPAADTPEPVAAPVSAPIPAPAPVLDSIPIPSATEEE